MFGRLHTAWTSVVDAHTGGAAGGAGGGVFALIAYSLLTSYDYAIWRVIPVGTHMTLDVLNGVFVMLAPWVFGYRDLLTAGQEVLHYVLALAVFGLVAITRTESGSAIGEDVSTTVYESIRVPSVTLVAFLLSITPLRSLSYTVMLMLRWAGS